VSSNGCRPFESPGKVDDEDNCSVSRLLEQTERRTRQLSHAGLCGGEEALSSLLAGARRLAVASERALLLVTFRPEFHAAWMQKSYYQQIPLLPLPAEAVGELLRELLGTDPSLERLGKRIRERTGGNPFFIEEIVQALAESGSFVGSKGDYRLVQSATDLVLPATVQAVLAARIDRLAGREKEVLQTAAVIGKEIPERSCGSRHGIRRQRRYRPCSPSGGGGGDARAPARSPAL
jgi:hypothetical protein